MTAVLLIAVVVLVFVNGFFVAAEFALVRSSPAKLDEMAEAGARGARLAARQNQEINEYLSACQFGITLASLGIGFLGEPAIADLIEPTFGDISHGVAAGISIAIAYILVTIAHITAGEQVPKIYAIVNAEKVARRVARPLHWFNIAGRPFIAGLNGAANWMLRLIRIDPEARREEGQSAEELRVLISRAHTGGHLDAGEAGMLHGVFHLHEQQARQVMTPIPAVVTVDVTEDLETALQRAIESGHTRLVVTEDFNPDHVRGIVHANALAKQFMAEGPHTSIEPLVREAPVVPETKPLDDLLAELQRKRTELAIVVDEYGRVAGLVTVEDIVEEVVGEISDETDPSAGAIRQLDGGDWFVRGHVPVSDLADYGIELPVEDTYNSVGGLVITQLGSLPKRGDNITVNGYSIRVMSVRENRVEAVRIRPPRTPAQPAPPATAA
jgi:CBS domain containing-hemolysin-like protein